ncbi:MAG: hypothetical protein M1824_001880 [Vezdaea acicularis]|nr:MAG: hypothetical protein M1824_001880 [Vezdaea acicularis]
MSTDYARSGENHIPVQSDDAPVEDPIDEGTADSDQQLVKDDNEAIDKSNIVEGRTRGAGPKGGYSEPDEDDLPVEVKEGKEV